MYNFKYANLKLETIEKRFFFSNLNHIFSGFFF